MVWCGQRVIVGEVDLMVDVGEVDVCLFVLLGGFGGWRGGEERVG